MATYPIKMLKDENNNPFVPLVSTECVKDPGGQSLDEKLADKLESNNIQAGDDTINVSASGNNVLITANLPAGSTLIDNLTTATAGQGALDAHQGKVLKDLIPAIVDDLTSTDATKALSAKQGYTLNQKFNDYTLTSALEALIKQYILASHPIGSIEINISGTNPSTYLGGTWIAWGTGKVPVGVDTTQTEFNSVEKTGGSKTASTTYTPAGTNTGTAVTMNAVTLSHSGGAVGNHTLTTTEIPAHSHGISRMANSSRAETGGCWVGDSQFHIAASRNLNATTFPAVISNDNLEIKIGNTGGGGAHNHGFTQPNQHSFTPTTKTITQPTFTGTKATITESTVQPYITCYMWKRTA